MDALEKHIRQLDRKSSADQVATRESQREQIRLLLATATDGRFRRSLTNALRKLEEEAPKKASGPDILPQLKELHALLDQHPDYRRKRRKRSPKTEAGEAIQPAGHEEPAKSLKLNKAFFGR